MKYLIHSCNSRLWYVKEYLIPSLIAQGIKGEDIILFNDDNNLGNLKGFLASCEYLKEHFDEDTEVWHLQDDVIICRDFKKRAEAQYYEKVVCGFVNADFDKNFKDLKGRVVSKYIWCSFPCIKIPVKYTNEFLDWFEQKVMVEGKHRKKYDLNRYDDFFFIAYLKQLRKNEYVYQCDPCLVDHIDYLLGGSVTNSDVHKKTQYRAYHFADTDLVEELQEELVRR